MKIAFFGTPEISRIFLEYISKKEEVVCVITSPDKPSGRGLSLRPSPVKEFALKNNLKVLTPENLNNPDFVSQLSTFNPQLSVVVSYGKIIPPKVFNVPKYGSINVHFSLLPKYRGAAPIQRALINGEGSTGVTIFFIDEGMDTGALLIKKDVKISDDDNYFSLEKKLTAAGMEALSEALALLKSGNFKQLKQSGTPSLAPILKKTDGKVNWNKSSNELHNLIRGLVGWPVAFTNLPDTTFIKIFSARPIAAADLAAGSGDPSFPFACSPRLVAHPLRGGGVSHTNIKQRRIETSVPGQITGVVKNEGFVVKCGDGFLLVLEVQPQNRRKMSAWDFLQSRKLKIGDILS